jgi:cysteinyl-tRNA synthetase
VVLADLKNKGFDPLSLRFFFLQAHYRSKQNFTEEALQAAENGLGHLYNQVRGLGEERGQIDADFKKEFIEALGDDFNTPQALEVTTRMLRSDIPEPNKLATIMDFDKVLGLNVAERAQESRQEQDIPQEIRDKAKERERLREEKRFEEADDLRKEIQDLGYIVEDSQEGSRIFKK